MEDSHEEAAFMGMVEYLSNRLKGLVLDYQKFYASATTEQVIQYVQDDLAFMVERSPEWWSAA